MNRLAAVILAGGRGDRLGGVDKARLKVGGVRLIDRVAESLSRQAATILVASRTPGSGQSALPADAIAISDIATEFAGPLAGIAAAVAWLQASPQPPEFLLSVAVDTPFFPTDFGAVALQALSDGCDAAIACYDGQPYPTNAVWRLSAIATLPARVSTGTAPQAPKFLLEELTASHVDWFPQHKDNPFANVNTLKELLILSRRALRSQTGQ
jgi:molybdopterin-guanine dinucleotide biosynthesis protein A